MKRHKQRKAERKRFLAAVPELIQELGGERTVHPDTFYDWKLQTLYGELRLSVMESDYAVGWIGTRFEDAQRASPVGCSQSGKWNFYFDDATPCNEAIALLGGNLERATGRKISVEFRARFS